MDSSNKGIQTSFIPKRSLVPKGFESRAGSFAGLFLVISIIIFVTTGVTFAGAYFYKIQISKKISVLEDSLDTQSDALKSEIVSLEDLARFDKKLTISSALLDRHVSARPLLKLLSDNTLKTVRFRNLTAKFLDSGGVEIRMSGEARSFNSIALQSKAFADTKRLSNIVFSNLNVGRDNAVVFDFSAKLKEPFSLYVKTKENINNQ